MVHLTLLFTCVHKPAITVISETAPTPAPSASCHQTAKQHCGLGETVDTASSQRERRRSRQQGVSTSSAPVRAAVLTCQNCLTTADVKRLALGGVPHRLAQSVSRGANLHPVAKSPAIVLGQHWILFLPSTFRPQRSGMVIPTTCFIAHATRPPLPRTISVARKALSQLPRRASLGQPLSQRQPCRCKSE